MKKKFDFILLPPDGFHESFNDLISNSRKNFNLVENKLQKICLANKKTFLIKYRTINQKLNFPCSNNHEVSYGKLLNYCNANTKVIGPVATAMLETLTNNISYYPYEFIKINEHNRMILKNYTEILHIANSTSELFRNLDENRIFKDNNSVDSLLLPDGRKLNDIIINILKSK
jgi:hypothetical protein